MFDFSYSRRHGAIERFAAELSTEQLVALGRIDALGRYRSPHVAFVDTPATVFSTEMTLLTGNAGGAVQSLPNVNVFGGKERCQVADIALAAQTSGTVFGVARLPLYSTLVAIVLLTDTSLGSTTIKLGDAHSGNSAIYLAAQTFTSTNSPSSVGLAATLGVPITTGYDCQTGLLSPYEDIILTTAVASLPGSGNLRIFFRYMID